MISKSLLTVPEFVKYIFDYFPLLKLPATPLPNTLRSEWNEITDNKTGPGQERKLVLYVYNIDYEDQLPTDPESLEIMGILRLKNLDNLLKIKIGSPHSAPLAGNKLPYLVDESKSRTIYCNTNSIKNNLLSEPTSDALLYQTLISTAISDWWIINVILDEKNRNFSFGEGEYRVPLVPFLVEQYLKDEWTSVVVSPLEMRYNITTDSNHSILRISERILESLKSLTSTQCSEKFVTSKTTNFFMNTKEGQNISTEIERRGNEALQVFIDLLASSKNGFLNLDGADTNEEGLGALDIQLFSYLYRFPHQSILKENPILNDYVSRVFSIVYRSKNQKTQSIN